MKANHLSKFLFMLFVLGGILNENTVPKLESDQIETEKVK